LISRKARPGIEGEHRHVDFGHDLFKQRVGFRCLTTVTPQEFPQRMHLRDDFAKCIVPGLSGHADGIIAFPQSRQKVGDAAEAKGDLVSEIERQGEPADRHQGRQRPSDFRGVVSGPN
jgi:hypothetical protein